MLTLATLHHLIDLRARARSAVTLGDQLVLGQHAAEQIGPHVDELLAIAAALERIRTLCRYPSSAHHGETVLDILDELYARQAPAGRRDVTDFSKLTRAQRCVLGCIAIGQDGYHNDRTLAKLEALGLIVRRDEVLPPTRQCRFPMTVRRWDVPTPVHIAWCEWCSRQSDVIAEVEQDGKEQP